jgi:hypothetical protein
MVASRRMIFLEEVQDDTFRQALSRAAGSPRMERALAKDAHLIEAANAMDRRVVSRDEEVRSHFRSVCAAIPLVRAILWANPEIEAEGVVAWLRAGAKSETVRRLDAKPLSL